MLAFPFAARTVWLYRRQNAFLTSIIAVSTFLLIVVTGFLNGMSANIEVTLLGLRTGHLNIGGIYKPDVARVLLYIPDARRLEELVRREVDGVSDVVVRHQLEGELISHAGTLRLRSILGIDLSTDPRFLAAVQVADAEHQEAGDVKDLSEPYSIALFASQAQELAVAVGDRLTLRNQTLEGVQNAVDVKLVAILQESSFFSLTTAFVDQETAHDAYQVSPASGGVMLVYIENPALLQGARQDIQIAMASAGYKMGHNPEPRLLTERQTSEQEFWIGHRYAVTDWIGETQASRWRVRAVQGAAALMSFLLGVVIAVGVANTMLLALHARTQEIGTLRAIGASRFTLGKMLVAEAFILAASGSILGIFLAIIGVAAINALDLRIPWAGFQEFTYSSNLSIVLVPQNIAGSVAFIIVICVIGGLWPSYRGMRISPVEALRSRF